MSAAHHLDRDGHCVEDCPHSNHAAAPTVIAIPAALKPLLDDWVEGLGLDPLEHQPLPPDEDVRAYVLRVDPNSPWLHARSPLG